MNYAHEYEPPEGLAMPSGLYRMNSVANAYKTLDQLGDDKLFNDRGLNGLIFSAGRWIGQKESSG